MYPFLPETLLELTRQRRAEEAEAARQWRLARTAGRPAHLIPRPEEEARLAEAGPAQRPMLLDVLARLSARTVYRRFVTPRWRWSERDLEVVVADDCA